MMQNEGARDFSWHAVRWIAVMLLACGLASRPCGAAEELGEEDRKFWIHREYCAPIELPAEQAGTLMDVLLGPRVFTHARADLADLRLYDAAGQLVPYALRVLRPTHRRDPYPAGEFNRAVGPDGSHELTLDLQSAARGQEPVEHNEVEIASSGSEFRRHVVVEGSDDGTAWSKLAETDLIRFQRGEQRIDGNAVTYPASRYRQLRVRVYPDPSVEQDPVNIEQVVVVRRIDVPGELVTHDGQLGPREPTRGDGGPGSAWIIDLGGNRVPCDRIEVSIEDSEFVRDFHVECGGPAELGEPFQRVPAESGVWQRRAGQSPQPITATFAEVYASRLRLVVTDHGNPPLTIQSVRFGAPARQIIFARPAAPDTQLRLFFGKPDAAAPNYDFARNLPAQLPKPPVRATLGAVQLNPDFIPPPKPWTERWPWLIYVVLGAASTVLALVILSVARQAIKTVGCAELAA